MKVVISLKGFVRTLIGEPIPIATNRMVCNDVKTIEYDNKELIIFYKDNQSEHINAKYVKHILIGEQEDYE